MIKYYIRDKQDIKKELVIENNSQETKLCKVLTDKGLYKLVIIEKEKTESIMLDDNTLNVIEVSEVSEEDMK